MVVKLDPKFKDEVSKLPGGQNIKRCFQCGTCNAGCPVREVVERRFNVAYNLPVLYYTQVLGLALGLDPKGLGLDMNRVKTSDLLSKLNV